MSNKKIDFRLIFIGLIFLFNPNYNIVDILPDFIGCIIIISSLGRLRDLSSELDRARTDLIYLTGISIAKLCSLLLVKNLNDQGYLLVFTFVFTIAEFIFMYKIVNGLFEGIFFVSTVYDCSDAAKQIQTAKSTSLFFVFAHNILTLLPEFVYLYVEEGIGYVLAAYKGVLNILSIILSLVIGIIWILQMKKFFSVLIKDRDFVSRLDTQYEDNIAPDSDLFIRRYFKSALGFFSVGMIFLCDFYIDGYDYLPDIIGIVLLILGIYFIRKYLTPDKMLYIMLGVYAAFGIASWIYMKNLAHEYYEYGISRSIDGLRLLIIGLAITLVKCAALGFCVYYIYGYYRKIIDGYTGRKEESQFESVRRRDAEKKKKLCVFARLYQVFGFVVAASIFVSNICLYYFDEYWLINLLFTLALCIVNSKLCYDVNYGIEEKYM